MSQIISVNTSSEKGTIKLPVPRATVDAIGIVGDAHAGSGHRQVSLLAKESIDRFSTQAGKTYHPGAFAENLTTEGLDLATIGLRDRLRIGPVDLEVTQIGKACHGDGCAIFREVGTCVMPTDGIFTRVMQGGEIRPGDAILHEPRPLQMCIVTLSDRASSGAYEDRSGPAIRARIEQHFRDSRWATATTVHLIPDDAGKLQTILRQAVAEGADAIFTTGGTGIGPRDITPDVVGPMLTKPIPGIMEYIRVKYGASIPSALLSRGVAGLINSTLVFTLPGSEKAVKEYMDEICRIINHALLMQMDIDAHH